MRPPALILLALALSAHGQESKGKPESIVDTYFEALWKESGEKPRPRADGYTFFRRASIDIGGRLPEAKGVRRWGRSRNPRKVVEHLLETDQAAEFFADMWIQWLANHDVTQGDQLRCEFGPLHEWLKKIYREDTPYPDFIHAVLTHRGDPATNPGANYALKHLSGRDPPTALANHTAKLFLGRDIQCAQCHDHPYTELLQDEYWGFTGFFRTLGRNRRELVEAPYRPRGEVRNDMGEIRLPPRFFDGSKPTEKSDLGPQLAKFIVSTRDALHARAIVERYWKHFFGRSLGKDHPKLKEAMVRDFLDHGQKLGRLIRSIVYSRPYQLESSGDEDERRACRAGPLKYMNPIQFFKAFARVYELEKIYLERFKARQNNPQFAPLFRDPQNLWLAQYRWAKEMILPAGRNPEESLASGTTRLAIKFLNSRDLQILSFAQFGIIRKIVKTTGSTENRVKALFVTVLGREPDKDEKSLFVEYVKGIENPYHAMEDVLWTLVNSGEFIFVR